MKWKGGKKKTCCETFLRNKNITKVHRDVHPCSDRTLQHMFNGTEYMGVSKNRGFYPQNGWFIMVPNPIKMDDFGGFTTPIFGNSHI